jgi:hypothetical protein
MGMLVQVGGVLAPDVLVQLLDRMPVLVLPLLARSMDMGMRVLVRVGVLVGMRVDGAIGMLVLMGMGVRVDMSVRVVVRHLVRHNVVLHRRVIVLHRGTMLFYGQRQAAAYNTTRSGRWCGWRPPGS